jgi:hypothetical protein
MAVLTSKFYLFIFLVASLSLSSLPAFAFESSFTSISGETITISIQGAITEYSYKNSIPVNNIKSVVLGSGVTNIGRYAFLNASNLVSITIPLSVTSIENNAFYGAVSLTTVYIPADNGFGVTVGPQVESFYGSGSVDILPLGH